MERYTEWNDGHGAGLPGKDCYTQLARYEDSGLTPDEVIDLNDSWNMYGGEEGITDAFERAEKARWIPVDEKLPEQGEKVLALWKYGPEIAVDFAYFMDGSMGERWRYKNWVAPPDAITHWMPLPSVEE